MNVQNKLINSEDKSFYSLTEEELLTQPIQQFGACCASGDLSNDRLKNCKICAANGFPHEPITWQTNRTMKKWIPYSDCNNLVTGTNVYEVKYVPHDYFTGSVHRHKSKQKRLSSVEQDVV